MRRAGSAAKISARTARWRDTLAIPSKTYGKMVRAVRFEITTSCTRNKRGWNDSSRVFLSKELTVLFVQLECSQITGTVTNNHSELAKEPLWLRLPWKAIGASLSLTLLCSCTSTVFNVRQIEQPVVLNGNPFLAPATPSSFGMTKVDTYSATIYRSQVVASAGNTTTSAVGLANQAQLNAFQMIGGQANEAICNVSLDADYWAVNALFLLAEKANIQAVGDVSRFQYPVTTSPLVTVNTKTNQIISAATPALNQRTP
jgi:hypothetical protein